MPIRVYECEPCGFRTERIEFTPDPVLPICRRCQAEHGKGVRMAPTITSASVHFRGQGWTNVVKGPKRGDE